jgi:hypothetical protein
MPAGRSPEIPVSIRTGLLIVCPADFRITVREHVSRLAERRWEENEDIVVLPVPREKGSDHKFVTSEINRIASQSKRDRRMLTVRGLYFEQQRLRDQILISAADQGLTLKRLALSRLPHALKGLRLDWVARLADSLANAWDHGNVDEGRIETWLNQFEVLGSHRWVGERLLRVMDFWPSARIRDALAFTNDTIQGDSYVCVNRRQPGKSADALANKIQKMLNEITSLHVSDLYDTLNGTGAGALLYFEDCLLTGTEITRLLSALLGTVPADRTPKVPPLSDRMLLRQRNIVLRFLVTTNLGREILTRFLEKEGLENIHVGETGRDLVTLTPLGVDALRAGMLFDEENCLSDPAGHIVPIAFQEKMIWRDTDRIERAVSFCREIGEQLFRQYLSSKGYVWPERRIRESSLGVRSIALALVFAHSVPKATLPLFWMGGRVRLDAKEIDWQPLFPSAA